MDEPASDGMVEISSSEARTGSVFVFMGSL
jgi:hypothetical protein